MRSHQGMGNYYNKSGARHSEPCSARLWKEYIVPIAVCHCKPFGRSILPDLCPVIIAGKCPFRALLPIIMLS